jgi:hypothetical protein
MASGDDRLYQGCEIREQEKVSGFGPYIDLTATRESMHQKMVSSAY